MNINRTMVCILAALLLALPASARMEEAAASMDEVFSWLDFSAVEDLRIILPGETEEIGVESLVRGIATGRTISAEAVVESVFGRFAKEVGAMGGVMLSIMLPVLLVSLLEHTFFSGKGALSCVSRSAGMVMSLVPVVTLVLSELAHTREAITVMTQRMEGMLPMLLTLLTALGGSASGALFHPLVAAASGSMVFLAREVVLRLVMCCCAVTTISHLSDRAHLSRLAQLIRSCVCWLLGVSFTVFLGAMSLQGVCSASIDGVTLRAAKYAADNFVPIIGGMFSDTMETLIGCTLIVKNALGFAAVIVLLCALGAPMIRTAAAVFLLRLCAALLEPVADAQIVRAIGDFSGTLVLFFVTMLCVATMVFLMIVQLLLVGNLTVMLR